VLLPLLRSGIDTDGVDAFAPMLERADAKARAEGFSPALTRAEMREFRLERRYALIIIPFNSYVHNLTAEDQVSTLRCCREHLLPGGKLTFDIFFPGADYRYQPQEEPVLELETIRPDNGNTLQMYDRRSLNPVEQVQHSENEIRELTPEGTLVRSHRFSTDIRWVTKTEMELLLRCAGFSRWEITRAFDGTPLTGASEGMLVTAWV
jgi:hypothetical protein